jgi:hypothetical protein
LSPYDGAAGAATADRPIAGQNAAAPRTPPRGRGDAEVGAEDQEPTANLDRPVAMVEPTAPPSPGGDRRARRR